MNKDSVGIIGGGIIGSYLALKIKELGYQVTIFEKNSDVGKKPCSGLVSERIFNFIPEAKNFFKRKVDFLTVHLGKKDIKINFNPPQYLFKRSQLDNFFLKTAKSAGVEIKLNQEINNIPDGFDKIVGCDGALSKIREATKTSPPLFKIGMQYFSNEKNDNLTIEVWPTKSGFFWRIPFGDFSEYGAIGNCKIAPKEFRVFLEKRKIIFKKEEIKSALIPCGFSLPENNNITLCGDAAGLTSPLSGGGIIWGLTAANILIKNFSDFSGYRKKARLFFRPKQKRANFFRNIAYCSINLFNLKAMGILLPEELTIDPNLFIPFWKYQIKY